MDKKQELQQRIVRGHRKIDQLCQTASSLPDGNKRDELYLKSIRMLQALESLEDGFMELYPGVCLFADKRCESNQKGTFHCVSCPEYMNKMFGGEHERESMPNLWGTRSRL